MRVGWRTIDAFIQDRRKRLPQMNGPARLVATWRQPAFRSTGLGADAVDGQTPSRRSAGGAAADLGRLADGNLNLADFVPGVTRTTTARKMPTHLLEELNKADGQWPAALKISPL
jgi:hypothetical protein